MLTAHQSPDILRENWELFRSRNRTIEIKETLRSIQKMRTYNGRLMRETLKYLDNKAREFPPLSILDLRPYATIKEISSAIGANPEYVWVSLNRMLASGRVRIYENHHKRKLMYGSINLPQVKYEEVLALARRFASQTRN